MSLKFALDLNLRKMQSPIVLFILINLFVASHSYPNMRSKTKSNSIGPTCTQGGHNPLPPSGVCPQSSDTFVFPGLYLMPMIIRKIEHLLLSLSVSFVLKVCMMFPVVKLLSIVGHLGILSNGRSILCLTQRIYHRIFRFHKAILQRRLAVRISMTQRAEVEV